jgi:scyllo-inositol 2-dehydrogenase (NADP+)
MQGLLNVALLGYGYAGRTLHAPLIASVPGLRLAAIGSGTPAKVHADLPDADVGTVDEVLVRPRVDVVVIATPNGTHVDFARRALEAGKHVVVDKPFTLTLAEARELALLAKRAGRQLSVFHNRRWDADFLTVQRLVMGDELGEIVHFEAHFDRYRPEVRQRWREAAVPGGGLWYDLGPHLVDQALQLFGPPLAIYGELARQRKDAEAVDYAHVLLRYPQLRVILHATMLALGETPRFTLHGTLGSYVKYGLDTQEDALKRGEMPGGREWGFDPRDGTLTTWRNGAPQVRAVPTERGDYRAYYADLRDAVLGRKPNPVPVEEAVAVMAVLELASESAAGGCELPFGETRRR